MTTLTQIMQLCTLVKTLLVLGIKLIKCWFNLARYPVKFRFDKQIFYVIKYSLPILFLQELFKPK